ncbi:MAG: hypothetical protein ABEJ56_03555 [Candidatus Nanohaloarchaea archaeon]
MGIQTAGIDQSGKVNKSEHDTAIVYCPLDSKKPKCSVFIPKEVTIKVEDRLKKPFKRNYRVSWFGPKMFSIGLYFLLRDVIEDINQIHMEDEYPGNMDAILDTLSNWFRDDRIEFDRDMITCPPAQNNFRAHELANEIRKNPDKSGIQLDYYHFKRKLL